MSLSTGRFPAVILRGLLASLLIGALLLPALPVGAAAPSISPGTGTIPFGTTSVAIAWDTGDGSPGQVWFRYNTTPEILFAQGPSGSQVANFIGQTGTYTFTLYKGSFASSPAAQGAPVAAQTIQTKAGPTRTGMPDVVAVKPADDGGPPVPLGSDGHYVSGYFDPLARPHQVYTTNVVFPAGYNPIRLDTTTTPHVVYIAFDAASLPSGAPRPAADVSVTPPGSTPALLARGPYGLIKFPYIVDGQYTLTLTDPTTGEMLLTTAFGTAAGVVTDTTAYSGGTGATVRFGFGSGTGNPTLVCVANGGTGAGAQFAANGSIAALNNGGAGVGTVTGLGVNATAYTLTLYTVSFSSGPQFIQSLTGTGQNCGAGTGAGTTAGPQVTNGTGAAATLTPLPITSPEAGYATFTINP